MTHHEHGKGFSLIELVIVVVIIAIIGAIAIPRMSRGAAGAADSALIGDLSILRGAIDLYQTEHGGTFPSTANIVDQLTKYTDESGATSDTRTANYIYGPYLRKVPPLPVGARKGGTLISDSDGAGVGWIYDATAGTIRANTTTETDARGTLYSDY